MKSLVSLIGEVTCGAIIISFLILIDLISLIACNQALSELELSFENFFGRFITLAPNFFEIVNIFLLSELTHTSSIFFDFID